jgi:DNA-binding LacI/PurR family transcriptional regulator
VKRKRPTQADVAKLAGVSQTTVSMVLNQQSGGAILISEETAQKVYDAMQTLGYAPDPVARMLAQGKNQLIGVFNYDPSTSYVHDDSYHKVLIGIENGAGKLSYNILLLTQNRIDLQRRIIHEGTNSLRLADGAILMGQFPDQEELQQLTRDSYPFIYIGKRDVANVDLNWVSSDYKSAGEAATYHLLKLGHRRLGYLCEKASHNLHSMRERWSGCQDAIQGAVASLVVLDQESMQTPEQFLATVQQLGITALICNDAANFQWAMQLLLHTRLSIPNDLSVLSLGDTVPNFGTALEVTHIKLNQQIVGEAAVDMLVARLEGQVTDKGQHVLVPCELVIGNTTAPLFTS